MNDAAPVGHAKGLTVSTVKAIFPIAHSDRRKNQDIFKDMISIDLLRNDDEFYNKIIYYIKSNRYDVFKSYDEIMININDKKKTFGFRALRWLCGQLHEALDRDEILCLPPDHFPPGTPEREVHLLLLGLVAEESSNQASVVNEGDQVAPLSRGWEAIVAELARTTLALDRPDVEKADHILSLARALGDACRAATASAVADAVLAARANTLRDRLARLGANDAEVLPFATTERFLEQIEAAVSQAEIAESAFVDSKRALENAIAAFDLARASNDFRMLGDLSAEVVLAEEAERSARATRDSAMEILTALGPSRDSANTDESPSSKPELNEIALTTAEVCGRARTITEVADLDGAVASMPDDQADLREPKPPVLSESADADSMIVDVPDQGTLRFGLLPDEIIPPGEPSIDSSATELAFEDTATLLARYLANGEIVLAWHLARLTETPIPAPILCALVSLSEIRQAEDLADPRCGQLLAELTATLPNAQDHIAAARLVLAALLRPALFAPDHGARDHLESLLGVPGLEAQSELIETLSGLGYDVRLSVGLLAQLSGNPPPHAEPAARQRLREWLEEARHRKTVHQPSYVIFHRELRPDGEIGRVVEAALGGEVGADVPAQSLIDQLNQNRGAKEQFVVEAERRSNRPRRDRIEGMALDWFCRGLQEACDHLSNWLDARRQDAQLTQDQGRERLQRTLGPIRKALQASMLLSVDGTGDLAEASAQVLAAKLEDLRTMIDGKGLVSTIPSQQNVFDVPLLRLPGGCQDWSDESPEFEIERTQRDRRLLAGLLRPELIARNHALAFEARLRERALLPAQRLIERLKEDGETVTTRESRLQRLAEELEGARRQSRERIARLRQSLTTIGYLDLDAATALPADLARLVAIDNALKATAAGDAPTLPAINRVRRPDVPPDFPELDAVLTDLEKRRDELRLQISTRQRTELEKLALEPKGDSARAHLEIFDRLDPVTVDDAIAEIKAGRDVPIANTPAPDVFSRFFPQFVADVADAGDEMRRGAILKAIDTSRTAGPFDFRDVDKRRARRMKEILETLGQAENSLQQGPPGRMRDSLAKLFELVGFSSVQLSEGREAHQGRLRLMAMSCDVPRRADGFLPAVFGSAAGGRYRVVAARSDVTIDQILRQIGSEAPDAPWLVVLFGKLDAKERAKLGRQARSEARSALVIDESLLLFANLESDDPLATVFDCAMPFAWVQTYTINAGNIPPEAFFGREAERAMIVSRDAEGCLIYGGRQLGKSVLLNHVRRERHRPNHGELAFYLDIKPIGGVGTGASEIWASLAHALNDVPEFGKIAIEPNRLIAAIDTWLELDPSRRMLVMFDEADNFLRAEHTAGYPNLLPFKSLMERTGRRFKAVFAGLHNVRRMARAPNSPLPHLGAPICIGPMNQSAANRAALRRLAVEPMQAAGLDYGEPELVSDMLARMNYYPSLVQVFGRQVVESYGRQLRPGGDGPRWRLDRDTLFEGAAAERIAEQIRDRFQLTLNLDVRYDCIARSIALHRLDPTGGYSRVLGQGLRAGEIRDIAFQFWPTTVVRPNTADFEELLEELADLGILSRFPDNRYGLRSAQVAQMLGGRDELEDALLRLNEREDDPAYDATLFYSSLAPVMPDKRAPLSDRDLDRLFDKGVPGLRIVRFAAAVVGNDVVTRVLVAARLWLSSGEHFQCMADDSQLRRVLDRVVGEAARPVVVVIEGDLALTTAAQLARHPLVARGDVLPIWCAPMSAAHLPPGVVFDAGAWPEAMLRHWLVHQGLAPGLDDVATRAALMEATGGASARLEALLHTLTPLVARLIPDRIAELSDWKRTTPLDANSLGLDAPDLQCLKILHELHGLDPSIEDLVNDCPQATPERLERLASVGVLRPGAGKWAAPELTLLGRLALG